MTLTRLDVLQLLTMTHGQAAAVARDDEWLGVQATRQTLVRERASESRPQIDLSRPLCEHDRRALHRRWRISADDIAAAVNAAVPNAPAGAIAVS